MNVSLRQLRAFLGVAESANFTKTAQRLHLSQAALSAAVRELESQLDCRLFDRTTRNVRLTAAGLAFLPTAAQVVRELEAAALRVQEVGMEDVRRLRVGVTPLIAAHVIPDVLEAFKVAEPGIVVDVTDAGPMELQRATESGEIDAAYGAFFSQASGLKHRRIMHWRLLVASSSSQGGLPVPLRWTDLAHYPLISLRDSSPVQQVVAEQLRREGVTPASQSLVNYLETQIAMAEKGFGLAIVPSFAAGVCRRYAVQLRPIWPDIEYEYSQIMRSGRDEPEQLGTFAAILADFITSASPAPLSNKAQAAKTA